MKTINLPKKEKDYQYSNNILINNIPKPQKKFIIWENDDIFNSDLLDFEFRLLQKLYSMKSESKVNTELLAKKSGKTLKTINRTFESLIQKNYIHISNDGYLEILRISKNTITVEMLNVKDLKMRFLAEKSKIENLVVNQ
ncbi:MAG: hypothetical protein ACOYMA_19325 [Bacteroidia bacterium]